MIPTPGSRQQTGLRAPAAGDGAKLPRAPASGRWHRCIDRDYGQPWWFSSRTDNPSPGRFDLERPAGTCYLAASAVGAIIERVADPDLAEPIRPTVDELRALAVWSGELMGPPRVADTTRAVLPRLTGELDTIVPYDLPWAWADAIRSAGADGLLYRARFARDRALGLFGDTSQAGATGAPRGDLVPTPALRHVASLPVELQPTVVGPRAAFATGPAPR